MRQMTPSELKQYLTEGWGDPLLLDVREHWEAQICRIEGARLLPMRQIPGALSGLNPRREAGNGGDLSPRHLHSPGGPLSGASGLHQCDQPRGRIGGLEPWRGSRHGHLLILAAR